MLGRADSGGLKNDVTMNAWPLQASYPCGSLSHAFTVCIGTENQNQVSFCPLTLRQVSILAELTLGHLRYDLTDVPPKSNSPPDTVFRSGRTSPNQPDSTKTGHMRPPSTSYGLPPCGNNLQAVESKTRISLALARQLRPRRWHASHIRCSNNALTCA
ncbi:unnamed protein product [Schistocephalus solidus]|uniref:Regulator of rDNA transcription protein 15 n=1 Tax=Schistocephalus solidus TaxID=70667 RepID=A0A183TNR7_SCHSO|nr:unnamed protein product [Schistocephalus solidus]